MKDDVVAGHSEVNQADAIIMPDVSRAQEIIATKCKAIGPRYGVFLKRTGELLRQNFPRVFQDMTEENLMNFIAVVDISGGPSRGQMKRLQEYCDGCGWCCSQTSRIVVILEDVERISRELKQKREKLFNFDGKDWTIKQGHPCQWWNPDNGRCAIYKIRPFTCRVWPQTTDSKGCYGLQEMPECRYSVSVLAYRVVEAVKAVSAGNNELPA
ncbi:MAG: YkgJ family cysteine cluster protein [Dehalogenimonas sp.]|uniref:YkgJ family cysteine cluster protein n=1 Tax=Candidatus Dehalogenimonas loeffleri TaxID=3127115 RepID=A0ABZ2J932_9CHLR|nr:YkgJ family cysteine cluster protein [Dehalogenimonas sp.]